MAYEVVMPYHLHMPSYFLETFTEYPFAELPFCFHIYQIKFIFCHTKKSKNFIIAANEANSS